MLFLVGSVEQQHQNYLGACYKCRIPGLPQELLRQKCWERDPEICVFTRFLRFTFEN